MITFNLKAIEKSLSSFSHYPFNYSVIDNFFTTKVAHDLGNNFPKYNSNVWHEYKSKIELKKHVIIGTILIN